MSWFMDLQRNGGVNLRELETLRDVDLKKVGIVYVLWMYVGFLILALCICNGFVFPLEISVSGVTVLLCF